MSTLSGVVHTVRNKLPHGGELPADEWERRHDAMTKILWAVAVAMIIATLALGYSIGHTLLHAIPLTISAVIAGQKRHSQRIRSLAAAFGLLTAAALGVHLSGGRIEAHFSFFVL